MTRGEVWWADLDLPIGRRPVLILVESQVEVFQNPSGTGRDADYASKQILTRSDNLTLSILGASPFTLRVADVVP